MSLPETQRVALVAYVQRLEPMLARVELPLALPALNVLRARRALALGRVASTSRLVDVLDTVDDVTRDRTAVDAALTTLSPDVATALLVTLDRVIAPERAAVLADVLEARDLFPDVRLAALLAEREPDRCDALLERARRPRPDLYVEAVTHATLSCIDCGRSPWPSLAARWQEVLSKPDTSATQGATIAARLRVDARADPMAALRALEEAISNVGADAIPHAIRDVISRAVRIDREQTWSACARVRWIEQRVIVIEALAFTDPIAQELARELDAVVTAWETKARGVEDSPLGATRLFVPAIAAAAVAGRIDLARRLIAVFGPTLRQVAECTVGGARKRFARSGRWDPHELAAMVPASLPDGELAMNPFLGPPMLSDEEIVTLWKVETSLELLSSDSEEHSP